MVANMGHWIDLSVHLLLAKRNFPQYIDISYIVSDPQRASDNISIVMTSNNKDLLSIFFSSRSEPFEGVSESIIFQQNEMIAKLTILGQWSCGKMKSIKNLVIDQKIMAIKIVSFSQCRKKF